MEKMNKFDILRKDMAEGHLSVKEAKLIQNIENEYNNMKSRLERTENLLQTHLKEDPSLSFLQKLIYKLFNAFDVNKPTISDYWNNKWKKSKIRYRAQGNYYRDIRNLICDRSWLLEEDVSKVKKSNNDATALSALDYVHKQIQYKYDIDAHNKSEYWQHPEETIQRKTGDCDDVALLVASLIRMCGIPAFRVKVCAGWVKTNKGKGGHAYCIYLKEKDNQWYVLDPVYYYSFSREAYKKGVPHKMIPRYYPEENPIWFTFNDKYGWAQKTTKVDNKLKDIKKNG